MQELVVESLVVSLTMVMLDVLVDDEAQMPLAERDDAEENHAPAGAIGRCGECAGEDGALSRRSSAPGSRLPHALDSRRGAPQRVDQAHERGSQDVGVWSRRHVAYSYADDLATAVHEGRAFVGFKGPEDPSMHGAPDGPHVALLNRCRGSARGDPMVSKRETTAGGGVALGRPVVGALLGGRRDHPTGP